jgi:N-acyl-L-homoserine lactone synthetase
MSLIVRHIQDDQELTEIYRLRYKVFCLEWGFEKPDNHSERIITDGYDKNAIHFAAQDENQKTVGAIMLLPDSSEGFPLEKYCELDINPDELPRDSLAEVSRMVIHRDYRRRSEDKYIYGPDEERRSIGSFHFQQNYPNPKVQHRRADDKYRSKQPARRTSEFYGDRRKRHEVVMNLYKAVYQESKRRQLTHWYAVMTKGIVNLLNRFGFSFEAIGDPVDYNGIRTPYMTEIAKLEKDMENRNPELYEEFTKTL